MFYGTRHQHVGCDTLRSSASGSVPNDTVGLVAMISGMCAHVWSCLHTDILLYLQAGDSAEPDHSPEAAWSEWLARALDAGSRSVFISHNSDHPALSEPQMIGTDAGWLGYPTTRVTTCLLISRLDHHSWSQ